MPYKMTIIFIIVLFSPCYDAQIAETMGANIGCNYDDIKVYRQSIRMVTTVAGTSENNQPNVINLWPGRLVTLTYTETRRGLTDRVWIHRRFDDTTGYRLHKSNACFKLGTQMKKQPYEEAYWIVTRNGGIYMFVEFDRNVRIPPSEFHLGQKEIYRALITYIVILLKPAILGIQFRVTRYEYTGTCNQAAEDIANVITTVNALRAPSSQGNYGMRILQGRLNHTISQSECRILHHDDSGGKISSGSAGKGDERRNYTDDRPAHIFVYHNIDRTRLAPDGSLINHERNWTTQSRIQKPPTNLLGDQIVINVPQPFGATKRIKLVRLSQPEKSILRVTLKTRAEEVMTEAFWGPGNIQPPFPQPLVLPYEFASVTLVEDVIYDRCNNGECHMDWMLIEPVFGRIRTSNGMIVPMNIFDRWSNAQFIMELKVESFSPESVVSSFKPVLAPFLCAHEPSLWPLMKGGIIENELSSFPHSVE